MFYGVSIQYLRAFCDAESKEFQELSRVSQYKALGRFKNHFNLALRRRSGVTRFLPQDSDMRINEFYKKLRTSFKEEKPNKIVVLDETAVFWNPITQTTLEHKGAKSVKIIADDEKKMATALLWGSMEVTYASNGDLRIGNYEHGRPLVIFKGVPGARIEQDVKKLATSLNYYAAVSEHGWVNESIFMRFLNDILPLAQQTTWIVLDRFRAHCTAAVKMRMKERGYIPQFIPAGCTSLLQVHDVYVNKPFKEAVTLYYGQKCIKEGKYKVNRMDVLNMVDSGLKSVKSEFIRDGILKLILWPIIKLIQDEDADNISTSSTSSTSISSTSISSTSISSTSNSSTSISSTISSSSSSSSTSSSNSTSTTTNYSEESADFKEADDADLADIIQEFDLQSDEQDDISNIVDIEE
jgi:hypothetical protein